MDKPKLIIIGAGWAGLAAATTAVNKGFDVTVIERSKEIGGRASSFKDEKFGHWLDNGPHLMIGAYRAALNLMKEWGCDDGIDFSGNAIPWIFSGGRTVYMRYGGGGARSALNIALLNGIPIRDRLKIIQGMNKILKLPVSNPANEITVFDFLESNGLNSGLCGTFWRSLTVAVMNGSSRVVGIYPLVRALREGLSSGKSSSRIGIPKKPFKHLYCDPALNYLRSKGVNVITGKQIKQICIENGDNYSSVKLNGVEMTSDALITTVLPSDLYKLLPADLLNTQFFKGLKEFEYSPVTTVHFQFDRPALQYPYCLFPDGFTHWVFSRGEKSEGGWSEVSALISHSPKKVEMSLGDITDAIESELRERLPSAARATVNHTRAVRTVKGTVLLKPGADLMRPDIETPVKGMYFAGDWVGTGLPATIESAARSGIRAVELVEKIL